MDAARPDSRTRLQVITAHDRSSLVSRERLESSFPISPLFFSNMGYGPTVRLMVHIKGFGSTDESSTVSPFLRSGSIDSLD